MMKGTLGRYALGLAAVGSASLLIHATAGAQAAVDICAAFTAGAGVTCAAGSDTISLKFGTTATDVLQATDTRINTLAVNASALKGNVVGFVTPLTATTAGETNAYVDNAATPTRVGVKGVDFTCNAQFSGSHACSARELYYAHGRADGDLTGVGTIFDTHPYVHRAGDGGVAITSSLKASCGNFTYGSADAWGRTTFNVIADNDPQNIGTGPTLRLDYAPNGCGTAADRRVACCS